MYITPEGKARVQRAVEPNARLPNQTMAQHHSTPVELGKATACPIPTPLQVNHAILAHTSKAPPYELPCNNSLAWYARRGQTSG